MPAKWKNGKKGKRNKRNNQGSQIIGLTKGISLFPSRWTGTMSYATAFTFPAVAASSMQATVLRFNSVYDPDYTGTGTAVAGYAAASSLYGRYRVIKNRAELTFLPLTNTVTAFAVLSNDSTLGTDYGRLAAQRYTWTRGIVPGGQPAHHVLQAPIHKISGVLARTVKQDDTYASLIGTNPTNQVYLHVGAYNPNASTASLQVTVRLVLTVEWSLPIEMSMP